jgi:hypothetical protein
VAEVDAAKEELKKMEQETLRTGQKKITIREI